MLKEKLRGLGRYILITVPIWVPIGIGIWDYSTSKHIDGYSIRQDKNSTVVYSNRDKMGNPSIALTTLTDRNNDGIIDKKIETTIFARRGIVLSSEKKVTEDDQNLYQGLLAKL